MKRGVLQPWMFMGRLRLLVKKSGFANAGFHKQAEPTYDKIGSCNHRVDRRPLTEQRSAMHIYIYICSNIEQYRGQCIHAIYIHVRIYCAFSLYMYIYIYIYIYIYARIDSCIIYYLFIYLCKYFFI